MKYERLVGLLRFASIMEILLGTTRIYSSEYGLGIGFLMFGVFLFFIAEYINRKNR